MGHNEVNGWARAREVAAPPFLLIGPGQGHVSRGSTNGRPGAGPGPGGGKGHRETPWKRLSNCAIATDWVTLYWLGSSTGLH